MRTAESYEVERGVPTLTIELERGQRMIPWHSFVSGLYEESRIELSFQDWKLSLEGEQLGQLWEQFQLQDVRVVRKGDKSQREEGTCFLTSLDLKFQEETS